MPLQYSSVFCMSLHVSCARHRLHFSARLSTEPLPAPTSAAGHKVYPPKIEALVKDITHLTLLETSQLNELLKVGWDCCCVLTFSWSMQWWLRVSVVRALFSAHLDVEWGIILSIDF